MGTAKKVIDGKCNNMRVTKKLKEQIFKDANYQCEYCGVQLTESNSSIDHKIPLSKGGTSDPSNLVAACNKCNMLKADKIIDFLPNPIAKKVAEVWIYAYIKSPKITGIVSIILVMISVVLIIYNNSIKSVRLQAELSKNIEFKAQIEQLDLTEKSIKQLHEFVSLQRDQVIKNEQSIKNLKEEKNALEPLVKADKAIVESLFKAQEIRAQQNSTRERWIGFGLGIVASIIASIFLLIVQYFLTVRKKSHNK